DGIDQVVDFVNNGPIPIDQQQIEDARQSVIDFVTSSQFGSGALAGVAAAIEVITGIVLGVFILFYFLKDGPRIWAFLIKPLNPTSHAKARRAGDRAVDTLGGYVRGTAIVALVDAVVIGGALVILQVPLALPLAIITFIGAFIPIIGATSAGILAALVALVTNDLQTALIVTIVVVAVNQLEGNFLAPVLLGKSLKLHELVVLLALTAGTILGGIVGTLLSVPLAGVAWTIIKSWNEQVAPVPGLDITDRDRRREVERRR
ncbi:MAG TPA: AI-2E family transporter, partial [Marisediminicola sp.]|nr:AI-2E family transporter [Marisediminicola sp.]